MSRIVARADGKIFESTIRCFSIKSAMSDVTIEILARARARGHLRSEITANECAIPCELHGSFNPRIKTLSASADLIHCIISPCRPPRIIARSRVLLRLLASFARNDTCRERRYATRRHEEFCKTIPAIRIPMQPDAKRARVFRALAKGESASLPALSQVLIDFIIITKGRGAGFYGASLRPSPSSSRGRERKKREKKRSRFPE